MMEGARVRRAALLVLLAAGCAAGPNDGAAASACEQFLERRVGTEVEFDDQHTIEQTGDLAWHVRSRFDDGSGVNVYECDVTHDGDDQWTLEELTTDR